MCTEHARSEHTVRAQIVEKKKIVSAVSVGNQLPIGKLQLKLILQKPQLSSCLVSSCTSFPTCVAKQQCSMRSGQLPARNHFDPLFGNLSSTERQRVVLNASARKDLCSKRNVVIFYFPVTSSRAYIYTHILFSYSLLH